MEKVIIVGNLHIEDNLANFLKEEGMLQEFIEETKAHWVCYLDSILTIDSISEGFIWRDSNKGKRIWGKLEYKYLTNS